ncbi:MAG: hypothetical protein EP330_04140 [Deltaproteobacteria bacterium]|nr:MAG: hypothetical protein EP330_04140 [Deltaproteobacteria bacterium]
MRRLFLPLAMLAGCADADETPVGCQALFCDGFEAVTRTDGVQYGISASDHRMNVFEPAGDSRDARPAVVLMGGGGFEGSDLELLTPVAEALAREGAVVGVARYRGGTASTEEEAFARTLRAAQDARAAVRFFRAEATTWRIEPEAVVLGGNGSGAITAVFAAYVTEDEIPARMLAALDAEGGLEGDQGHAGPSSEATAVLSLAGGIYEEALPTETLDAGEAPFFGVHGLADAEFPSGCEAFGAVFACGGQALSERASEVGVATAGVFAEGGGHDHPRETPEDWVPVFVEWMDDQPL